MNKFYDPSAHPLDPHSHCSRASLLINFVRTPHQSRPPNDSTTRLHHLDCMPSFSPLGTKKMEGRRQIRRAGVFLLGVLLVVAMAGRVGAVEPSAHGQAQAGAQDAAATVKQVQAVWSQVWELLAPWVQWAKSIGRDLFAVVYERASLQGLKSAATEAGRIGFDFFSGRPYQAAYEVARDVPGVGRAVKEVVGEANLRKKAAREQAEDKEL